MNVSAAFFSIPVANYMATRVWYEKLFGRKADMIPNDHEMYWQLADKAWLYVIDDATRAGKTLLTLIIDDLDAQVAALKKQGIVVDTTELTDHYRKANYQDPEGNTISLTELNDEVA